jgi:small conductance mechanosensitive channel
MKAAASAPAVRGLIAVRLAIAATICASSIAGQADASSPEARAVLAQFSLPIAAPATPAGRTIASGVYVTLPIVLDGATLFSLGAPSDAPATQTPLAARVADVQTALEQLTAQVSSDALATKAFEPGSLRVHMHRHGNAIMLEAVDANHSDPLPIVTVTSSDAKANGEQAETLAAQWQSTLQSALIRALELREPQVQKRNERQVGALAIGLLAFSLVLIGVLKTLRSRMERLEREVDERLQATAQEGAEKSEEPESTQAKRRIFIASLRSLRPAQRLNLQRSACEALLWVLLLAWFLAITWSLSRFAGTTPLADSIQHGAFGIGTTLIVSLLLNRLLDIVIERMAIAWRILSRGSADQRARFRLRIPTVARAVRGAKAFTVAFIATLTMLGQIGVPIGSVVTIGGLAAVALSLAAQNFVRDFLNGYLVLYEDHYVVGDYVTINAFSGTVEVLTLRMVQVRDAAGDLVTIPHSSVVNVVNQSRNWSRVDYRVPVDPGADVSKAMDIVRTQIEALAHEGDWVYGVAAPIEWIGIDGLSKDAIVIRVSIKTAPLRQFEVRRQLNERVRAAFVQGGIALGAPPPA